jgi:hypothetical protein
MSTLLTTVLLAGSSTVMRALEMSKLPNGSLMSARTNTVAPGALNAAFHVVTLFTLMTVALLRSTRE